MFDDSFIEKDDDNFIFTVSSFMDEAKEHIESNYSNVMIVGEVSRLTVTSSLHMYFTLKDKNAAISCVMFKGYAERLNFDIEEGTRIIITGRATIYSKRGDFQINVYAAKPEGVGMLAIAFEELKARLKEAGYFEQDKKKDIPKHPKCVGVITSETGAAIHDILSVSERRAPNIDIIIYPSLVQGESAAQNIASMIKLANTQKMVDLLIVGRGGGSIEDLWAFNEEVVADAIYESSIPIVSAVGHESDFTISDMVADLRAGTPSISAEIVFPDITSEIENISYCQKQMIQNIEYKLSEYKYKIDRYNEKYFAKLVNEKIEDKNKELDDLNRSLDNYIDTLSYKLSTYKKYIDKSDDAFFTKLIVNKLEHNKKDIEQLEKRQGSAMDAKLSDYKNTLKLNMEKLHILSPLNTLKKGYSVAFKDGDIIKSVDSVNVKDNINVKLSDGEIICEVESVKNA